MIDYDATLQAFFAECQKFLGKRAAHAKDKFELNAINNAINMVRTIAANPKKYADYNARVAAGFESPDMATGFVLGGDNSAYWTYSSVVNSMGELYNKYEYQRAQAQKKLLNALKSMKYKNAGNILKDLYYPFLSPEKFAVKSQKQK